MADSLFCPLVGRMCERGMIDYPPRFQEGWEMVLCAWWDSWQQQCVVQTVVVGGGNEQDYDD